MKLYRRLPLPAAFVGGIALGLVAALIWTSLAVGRGPNGASTIDRAALESLLAERTVNPTGQTRRFELTVAETEWELMPGVRTKAVTFNGTVPGPTIRVTEGDMVEVVVRNDLNEGTSIHWHGVHVPNDQDGVSGVTQDAIQPGATYTYRFVAPHAGTFMYHAHGPNSREQMDRGLYAPFIIDPAGGDVLKVDKEVTLTIGNWMVGDSSGQMPGMDMGGDSTSMSMEYDYFTINGKSYPATTATSVQQNDLVRVRFLNPSQTVHPMHLHGTDMAVIAKDGEPLTTPQRLNVLNIAPGETYDVVFRADNPGTWLLHCHDLHHASNAGVEPGGLIVPIIVTPAGPAPATSGPAAGSPAATDRPTPTMDPGMTAMPGMDSMPGMAQ